jgi:hypothetical protein
MDPAFIFLNFFLLIPLKKKNNKKEGIAWVLPFPTLRKGNARRSIAF